MFKKKILRQKLKRTVTALGWRREESRLLLNALIPSHPAHSISDGFGGVGAADII